MRAKKKIVATVGFVVFLLLAIVAFSFFNSSIAYQEKYNKLKASHFVKLYDTDRLFTSFVEKSQRESERKIREALKEATFANQENQQLKHSIALFQQKENEWKKKEVQGILEKKKSEEALAHLRQLNTDLEQEKNNLMQRIEGSFFQQIAEVEKEKPLIRHEGDFEQNLEEENKTLKHQIYLYQAQLKGFEDVNQKLQVEREARIKNERMLKEMRKHLEAYSIALERMEDSRQELEKELEAIQIKPLRTSEPTEDRYYKVEAGDSLSLISVKVYGTARKWESIFDANRTLLENPDSVREGMRLYIPKAGSR